MTLQNFAKSTLTFINGDTHLFSAILYVYYVFLLTNWSDPFSVLKKIAIEIMYRNLRR